jgi:MerR family transcriptional regulator, light-induced transcriptional regulator
VPVLKGQFQVDLVRQSQPHRTAGFASVEILSMFAPMHEVSHSIRVAAQRTGLSPHVIRIWEKRYGVVEPGRTDTNRRRYTEAEIERLALLRRATEAGHSIGTVARLRSEQVRDILAADRTAEAARTAAAPPAGWVEQGLAAIRQLDGAALERVLHAGAVELGHQGLLCRFVGPLASALGEHWQRGELTAAHEHFASAHIKAFLTGLSRSFATPENAPRLVAGTPAGQLHELGAVMVASAAANAGWNVTYLGPNLPAAEIAGAVRQRAARAVALSVVYPADCDRLRDELRRLRRGLPPEVALLVGGRAAPAYEPCLREIGARLIREVPELCAELERLRQPA